METLPSDQITPQYILDEPSPLLIDTRRDQLPWLDPSKFMESGFLGSNTLKYILEDDPETLVRITRGGYIAGWQTDRQKLEKGFLHERHVLHREADILEGYSVAVLPFEVRFVQPSIRDLLVLAKEAKADDLHGVYVDNPNLNSGVDIYIKVPVVRGVDGRQITIDENTLGPLDATFGGLINYYIDAYTEKRELLADIAEPSQFVLGSIKDDTKMKLYMVDIDIESVVPANDKPELDWLMSAVYEALRFPNPSELRLPKIEEAIHRADSEMGSLYPKGTDWLKKFLNHPNRQNLDYDDLDKLYSD